MNAIVQSGSRRVLHVVGARPNFMKLAPVHRALAAKDGFVQTVVHTGQHYDSNMSQVFFEQLDLPHPGENLGVGSGSQARQTAEVMMRIETVLARIGPDIVMVYGDVNSTVAASLVCAKLQIPVAHVEAGLRSFDRRMPEEINRLVTDQLASLHFTSSPEAECNLKNEGVNSDSIHFVGNVMVDTLLSLLDAAREKTRSGFPRSYGLVTLHRPSNVDDPERLRCIMAVLEQISRDIDIVFPVHPRTRQRLTDLGLKSHAGRNIHWLEPTPYLEFLAMESSATFVITDSGGVQEETTVLGIPCLTLRENTERPVTVTCGTNILIGTDMERLCSEAAAILNGRGKRGSVPELWDGHAGERIADVLEQIFEPRATAYCA